MFCSARAARGAGKRGIALDLPGFGKPNKPNVEYTVELFAKIISDSEERFLN